MLTGKRGNKKIFDVDVPEVDVDISKPNGYPVDEDKEETDGGYVAVGGDLKAIYIRKVEPSTRFGNAGVQIWRSNNNLKMWTSPAKTSKIMNGISFSSSQLPKTIYVEGISPGTTYIRAQYTPPSGNGTAEDKVKITVIKVDLTATDLDGAVADATEATTGAYVHWNLDNDDASDNAVGYPKRSGADYLQIGAGKVTGEDDLKSLAMSLQPGINQGSVVLNIANANAKVWKDAEKGSANLVLAGSGNKIWNLANAGEKAEFLNLCSSLWVEGVNSGTCNLSLSYKDTAGNEICSDKVKYTFISADCGRQPKTDTNERNDAKSTFPSLVHCEWSITAEATPVYNCIAWSVGETTAWYNPDDIDSAFGDNDGTLETSDMDAFYLAKKGWTPTATGASDAEAMYFSGYHGAKKKGCACGDGKWVMFESKCGQWIRMEHVWNQLNGALYGTPTRFYK